MKSYPLFLPGILCLFVISSPAAVVQTPSHIAVSGIIDGSNNSNPDDYGDTLDFLKFEILTTSNLVVYSEFGDRIQLWLGGFVGDTVGFDHIGINEQDLRIPFGQSRSFPLGPGIYVLATGMLDVPMEDNQFYDVDLGYVPVNPLGGGFTIANYRYSLTGDIRALEFRDGELNNTFIVTRFEIPEPTTPLLAALACTALLRRRRRV